MSNPFHPLSGAEIFDRIEQAIERNRSRLVLATCALSHASIPYAVSGDWASNCHVARMEIGGERNCVDIEIIVRRTDFARTREALADAGLIHRSRDTGEVFFLAADGDNSRNGVDLFIAGARVRPNQLLPTPDPDLSENGPHCRVLSLEAFVQFALSRFRTLDRVHLRDLLGVGAVGTDWLPRLPQSLSVRLKEIIDDPRG